MFARLVNLLRGRRCANCKKWIGLGADGMSWLCPDPRLSGDSVACRAFEPHRPPPPPPNPPPNPPPSPPSYVGLGLALGAAAWASAHSGLKKGTGQWKN